MELIWTDLAKESVKDIAAYVASNFSEDVARKAVVGIYSAVQNLRAMPLLGRRALDYTEYGEVRCLTYKQNQIYYVVGEDTVTVIIVWDGRQNPQSLMNMMLTHFFMFQKEKG